MKKLYVVSALAALLATAASAAAPAEATKAAEPVKAEVAKPAAKTEAKKDAKEAAAPHKDEAAVAHKGGKKHARHGNTCALADMLNGDVKPWHMPTAEEIKAEAGACKKACHKDHKAEKKHDSAADVKKAPEAAAVTGDKKPAAAESDAEESNEA